jgi:hypothetical protein
MGSIPEVYMFIPLFAEVLTEKEINGWAGLIIAIVIVVAILRKKKFSFRGTEHGSASWADDASLKKRGMLE